MYSVIENFTSKRFLTVNKNIFTQLRLPYIWTKNRSKAVWFSDESHAEQHLLEEAPRHWRALNMGASKAVNLDPSLYIYPGLAPKTITA